MARPLRVQYENATYHVFARGHRKEKIFLDDRDREKFLEILEETWRKYTLRIYCYVLMPNHYHLVMSTPAANLSDAMHYLNTSYANWFRTRHQIVGSIFQGRYKALLVDKDNYLLVLSAYVHLNPLKAGIVEDLSTYRWSSYRAYVGKTKPSSFLDIGEILDQFGEKNPYRSYEKFVADQWEKYSEEREEEFEQGIVIGDEDFKEKVLAMLKGISKIEERELPAARKLRLLNAEDVERVMEEEFGVKKEDIYNKKRGNVWRKLYLFGLKEFTALRLTEIGERLGMDYTAVSQAAKRLKLEAAEKRELKELVERLRKRLGEKCQM